MITLPLQLLTTDLFVSMTQKTKVVIQRQRLVTFPYSHQEKIQSHALPYIPSGTQRNTPNTH